MTKDLFKFSIPLYSLSNFLWSTFW